jgi:membrane protein YqaA with SNARE-associated domain
MWHRLVEIIEPLAASYGGPGLLLLAFLDSSFLSFPEVPDFLIVWLVTQHPSRWLYYASMTSIGSVLGCYVLCVVARKAARPSSGAGFARHTGAKPGTHPAIRCAGRGRTSILPPPAPFKIFVILAGLAGIGQDRSWWPSSSAARSATGLKRCWPCGSEAAMRFINENLARLSIWVAVTVAVLGVAYHMAEVRALTRFATGTA